MRRILQVGSWLVLSFIIIPLVHAQLPFINVTAPGATPNDIVIDQSNGYIYTLVAGGDLWLSKDSAASWTKINSSLPTDCMGRAEWLSALAVDSNNHYIYVGTWLTSPCTTNYYVSKNFGVSWSMIAGHTDYSNTSTWSITVAPNGNALFVGHFDGTVWVSTDGGSTCFQSTQPGIVAGPPPHGSSGWGYVDVNRVTGEVWAGHETGPNYDTSSDPLRSIWRSTDNGLTFTQTAANYTASGCNAWPGASGNTSGFGYDSLGNTYELGYAFHKSTDHGDNWGSPIPIGTGCSTLPDLRHDMVTDSNGILYVSIQAQLAGDTGMTNHIIRSTDNGTTWNAWDTGVVGLSAPRSLAINSCDGYLYTLANNGLYRTSGTIQTPACLAGTPTPTATQTATPGMTSTASNTATVTCTWTISSTSTVSGTATQTLTASATGTASNTVTQTPTKTQTATITLTGTASPTYTVTQTLTDSGTPTQTRTPSQTLTPSDTFTPSLTFTNTPTFFTTPPAPGTSFIYPSPATGNTANIVYYMSSPGSFKIRVYNDAAELVETVEGNTQAGPQVSAIDIKDLASGVYLYIIKLDYGSQGSTKIGPKKFIVLH